MQKDKIINPKRPKWVIKKDITGKRTGPQKIIDELLFVRGHKSKKQKDEFLKPKHPKKIRLQDTGIKPESMAKAIKRLSKSLKQNEQIVIFGDYDADGICSTAIVWEVLDILGFNVLPHIPKREDGYGIKKKSLDEILEKFPKTKIIVTVDNGIVAHEAVLYANSLGIDVIILDHHERSEKYPDAFSIVHTVKLCGAGISYFFAREIVKSLRSNFNSKTTYHDPIDLAAIGTVADQMELVGTNRSIVKYGLGVLRKTKRWGINSLLREAAIDKAKIGTYEINYAIAPRLNAMGRIDEAMESLRLICSRNSEKSHMLAIKLGETNRKRQAMVERSLKLAFDQLKDYDISSKAVVVGDENFHEGVIGLIASKITETFYLPSVVFSIGGKISKASARSIRGFNINSNIRKLSDLIVGGGGHEMAAGFSIKNAKLKQFKREFLELSKKAITADMLQKKLNIDAKIGFNQINWQLVDKLEALEPFGIGNPSPLFCTDGVEIESFKKVGSTGSHMKMVLKNSGINFDSIYFKFENSDFVNGKKVTVAYQINKNFWDSRVSLQLVVKDIDAHR